MKTTIISLGLLAAACGVRTTDSTSASTVDHYSYTPAGIPQLASPPRDGFGRATSVGGATLAYGPDGALARASRGSDVIEYITDEAGNRLAKRVNGTVVEAYVDGAVVADTLYLPVRMGGATVGVIHHGAFESVETDSRGSLLADGQGATAPAPFGERTRSSPLERVVDFAQSGRDTDLGVIRMGVRDYDPRSHQFLTPDPLFLAHPEKCIESPVDCNLYSYARNRPGDFIDPAGTEEKETEPAASEPSAEGNYKLSIGLEVVNVKIVTGADSWSCTVDIGMTPAGVQVGVTSEEPATSEIALKAGYEANLSVGPLSLAGASGEAKLGTDGASAGASGSVLWFEGGVEAGKEGIKPTGALQHSFEPHAKESGAGRVGKQWKGGGFEAKAGPTAALSVTVNSAEAKTWPARIKAVPGEVKAWVQDHTWVWHPDQWVGHTSPFQFAGTRN
jgi:RHS repeat-associated protein